jgi:hypothetical protein
MNHKEEKQTAVEYLYRNIKHLCNINDYGVLNILFETATEMYNEETMITENTSDGYHTFKLLYDIRKAYNVALFNEWAKLYADYNVHKSKKHFDGEYPFGDENWFIVSAKLPSGQISNHYHISDWDLFKISETPKALFEFDGHTSQDVIDRLLSIKY